MTKPKTVKQLFREGLKAARLKLTGVRGHYVTPEELGKDVGVSGQTIRNYESGASEPSLDMIAKLGEVTGVTLAWPPFGAGEGDDDLPKMGHNRVDTTSKKKRANRGE